MVGKRPVRLGRNQPCVCGSGKKYKKCCLVAPTIDHMPSFNSILLSTQKLFRQAICSHPSAPEGCHGLIVRAHTLSRAAALDRLAVNGHVLGFKGDMRQFVSGRIEPRLIGVREASTFSGFCSAHDTSLFRTLDDPSHFAVTPENVFLLSYRAVARECYGKQRQLESLALLRNGGPDSRILDGYDHGVRLGVNDIVSNKRGYDDALLNGDLDRIRFRSFVFATKPQFGTSNAITPELDFDGNYITSRGSIRNPSDKPQLIVQNVIPVSDEKTVVVFSWLETGPAVDQFVRSLEKLPGDRIAAASIRYAFEFAENSYFSTRWWESLDGQVRKALVDRLNLAIRLEVPRKASALVDDGHSPVAWSLVERRAFGGAN